MGWKIPKLWVEDAERGQCLLNLSNTLQRCRWKAFLLGHQKYGPKPSWDPVEPLRGFPENLSDHIRYDIENDPNIRETGDLCGADNEELDHLDATYYSLSELQSIDLDVDIGYPETDEFKRGEDDYEYAAKMRVEVDGEVYHWRPESFDIETIARTIYIGPESTTLYELDGEHYSEKKLEQAVRRGRESETDLIPELDPDEAVERTGTISFEPRQRRDYAPGWDDLLDLLETLADRSTYHSGSLRVVMWVWQ
jgi:hypothetical protein